jgi:hypothetical protein
MTYGLIIESSRHEVWLDCRVKLKRYEIYHYYKSRVVEDRDKLLLTNHK